MKKELLLILFSACVMAVNAQTSGMPASIVGLWTADAFDSYEHKIGSGITIQFTQGDIIFFGTNNKAYANGIYQYSGNVLSGSYNVTSNGTPVKYSFQGNYDIAKQKLVFTTGSGNAVNGEAHYEATKKTAPVTAQSGSQSQANTKTDADYFLTAVNVVIKTGKDNKEYPSRIAINVGVNDGNIPLFALNNYKDELKINSTTVLNLTKNNYPGTRNSLADYKAVGLRFRLNYLANLPTDAWKIENISLLLEFKDEKGNPHPTMGKKTIDFTDSNLWADGFSKIETEYKTDKNFNPLKVRQYDPLKP